MPINVALGGPSQRKIIVVSHERSGTHFLMNTLSLNFGYVSQPWINFDYDLGINYHSSADMLAFLKQMHDQPVINIIKSHHHYAFFHDIIDYLLEQFQVFYICRDPRDLMTSFWKFMNKLQWDEGPKEETVGRFMRTAPRGGILRYQKEQHETMLHRWRDHVERWLDFIETAGTDRAVLVRYEDLNDDFIPTMRHIGEKLGKPAGDPQRPNRSDNVVLPGEETTDYRKYFLPEDNEFIMKTVGGTMERLNYYAG